MYNLRTECFLPYSNSASDIADRIAHKETKGKSHYFYNLCYCVYPGLLAKLLQEKKWLLHKGKSVTNLHLYVHASVCECAKGGQWKQSNTGTERGLQKAVAEVTCHSASYRTLAYKAGHAGLD